MSILFDAYWEVDGFSGHSFINAKDIEEARYIFECDFARFGYKLTSLSKN